MIILNDKKNDRHNFKFCKKRFSINNFKNLILKENIDNNNSKTNCIMHITIITMKRILTGIGILQVDLESKPVLRASSCAPFIRRTASGKKQVS